ncbi:hypothetical protein HDU91_000955 [Kappamyces sp. JEL0680]|nr:hypothetical protein HDU91_000955 [Kappamyces sp. JEL0680]
MQPNRRPSAPANASNPLDLVRGEIAILKMLDHRNVVKLYEVLDDPSQDSLFMVFELCERGPVLDITMDGETKPLPVDLARDYFQQLILGIEYLHEHEIAHRDIKPDNMLIAADGVVKIVDFGVSEIFSKGNDKMKGTAGSPAFYPPENVGLTKGDLSGIPADIWAMGVTLYALVFGKLPFTGKTIIALYESIRETQYASAVDHRQVYPPGTDPRLVHVLDRLGKKPLISFEENCQVKHIEITDQNMEQAVIRFTAA